MAKKASINLTDIAGDEVISKLCRHVHTVAD